MSHEVPRELTWLRHLFTREDPVPAHVIDTAYAAPARTGQRVHTQSMELVDDSAESDRGEQVRLLFGPTRALTFHWPSHALELELTRITTDAFSASGLVVGPSVEHGESAGVVELRHRGGTHGSQVDAHGGFRVDAVPSGPVSVVFRTAHLPSVVADWLVW